MKRFLFAIGLIAAILAATTASAEPINPFNSRPVPVTLPSPDGTGKDLQTILDTMFMCTDCVSATDDQQSAGMWRFSAYPFTSIPTLAFEYTANDGVEGFGIWSDSNNDTDASGRTLVPIFGAASKPGDSAGVSFDIATQMLTVAPVVNIGLGIASGQYAGINPLSFGFYLERIGGIGGSATFYTLDQLNGGVAQSLAYRKPDSDTWAIAFEDLSLGGSDKDYNDIVVKVESIEPVPEPSTFLLLGTALLGGIAIARRRFLPRG